MDWQAKQTHIAEEAFMVLHSGEIPEVFFHSSLYYLSADPDGPGLELGGDDVLPLKQAVVQRYRAIILRDLEPGNRDKSIYRGLGRCLANWERLLKFCTKEKMDSAAIRDEAAEALRKFLKREMADVKSRKRSVSINCSYEDVEKLTLSLGLSAEDIPEGLKELCPGG